VLNPERTLAIVCGAHEWPELANFEAATAFVNSAGLIRDYLIRGNGLGLATDRILWLFGEPGSGVQYERIKDFLQLQFEALGSPHGKGVLILFFYVGHGAFFGRTQEYCLLLRDTHGPLEADTSLRVASLAQLFRSRARESSRILFLDCCFAAEAARAFQVGLDQAVSAKAREVLEETPTDQGVALFCASSARNIAKMEKPDSYTLFSRQLIQTLTKGDPDKSGPLSLRQLCNLVQAGLEESGVESPPKPEVHVPDQAGGDLAAAPLFPNPAWAEGQRLTGLHHAAAERQLDHSRLALVTAKSRAVGASGGLFEEVGTGYFLTGNLVLTARHIAARPDCILRVRVEADGSDKYRWSEAEPQWIGTGDVDAMLLRTASSFGNWEAPTIQEITDDMAWESAGYASIAADEEAHEENPNTLSLCGSCITSVGPGPKEIELKTEQSISENWEDYWQGISGAPVFSKDSEDNGLIGIMTDAGYVWPNGLVGLPATRLLNDIRFRSLITPSFLGPLPTKPWCLVLTEESSRSQLVGQVAGVLAGFRFEELLFPELHRKPIEIPVLEAIKSAENWAITVDALARADFLIADVTSFEPAVMLLLGIRSVVRRGVTISVTKDELSAFSSSVPFNVQETRVLSCKDHRAFYDDLRRAMTEGAANLARDSNYLDLPAYHAVRAPRPETWAENDVKSLLVLCPFGQDYSDLYETELDPIIRGHTGNMTPLRMLDLRSPRLVGQALYEQIRWSSRCLVDWTSWRPNVFFELGVRLACSEYDPLCIIERSCAHYSEPSDPDGSLSDTKHQHELLRNLLRPVEYDRASPREDLVDVLESWPGPLQLEDTGAPSMRVLPPAATFAVAQASFQWQRDTMLTPPHLEQRKAAEQILGKDQERRPERLILFADNQQFDAELRAVVREKWIVAWLYLKYLYTADEASPDDARNELITVGRLAQHALSSSTDPRHIRLRREIRQFLRDERT
jgi:hypothetical protein